MYSLYITSFLKFKLKYLDIYIYMYNIVLVYYFKNYIFQKIDFELNIFTLFMILFNVISNTNILL